MAKDLNNLLTSAIKEIVGLPNDVPNAPKNLRGLGIITAIALYLNVMNRLFHMWKTLVKKYKKNIIPNE